MPRIKYGAGPLKTPIILGLTAYTVGFRRENDMDIPKDRRTTLNNLREQLHSLNMRMLLAVQSHNEEAQEEIKGQMAEVQEKIDRMCFGSIPLNRN